MKNPGLNSPIGLQNGQPYHFCTYFDRNYLNRGLALYHSLRNNCKRQFTLWILCFDEESYNILSGLSLEGISLISRADFEFDDAALSVARSNRNNVEYYWTCTPSLPLYVFYQDPTIDVITYLDADLYFFSNPQAIFDELAEGSILIHGHRYAPEYTYYEKISGIYNVGLLCFRRDATGLACLNWWRDRCVEWCYARYQDGKYGDQMYLDDWPSRFAGVVVLQHPGAGLAPWNVLRYQLTQTQDELHVDGHSLIFFHFHGLKVLSKRVFTPSGNYTFSLLALNAIYQPYIMALRRASDFAGTSFIDPFVTSTWRNRLRGLFFQDNWLNGAEQISLLLWKVTGRNRRARYHLETAIRCASDKLREDSGRLILLALAESPLILISSLFLKAMVWWVLGHRGITHIKLILSRLRR